jgi:FkbM family methyltransferase
MLKLNPLLRLVDLGIRCLTRHLQQYAFLRLAGRLDVSSVTHAGPLGVFEGDPRDRVVLGYLLGHGTYAPELQALLQEVLFASGEGTLIDAGANIGLTSIPVARARSVACHCFEPDPANHTFLARNVIANGVQHLVTLHPFALMAEEGSVDFERSPDNMGDHRVRKQPAAPVRALEGEHLRQVTRVPARRLDAVLASVELKRPVVLKVDTQGADVQVLRGASGLLRQVDFLIAEYSPYLLRRMGDSPEAYFEQLRQFERGAVLDGAGHRLPALVPIEALIGELRSRLPADGSSADHLDVILARRPAP